MRNSALRKASRVKIGLLMKRWTVSLILFVTLFSLRGIAFASQIDDVRATVYAWANAWESRNIIRYMSFYSPTFRSKGLDYQDWLHRKAELFRKPVNIQVKIFDLWVFIEGKHATAKFVQHYQDANTTDTGEKTLFLVNANDKWMIISEEWMPLKQPAPTTGNYATITKRQVIERKIHAADNASRNHSPKKIQPNEIIVKNIKFNVEKDYETVCIHLNKFYIPVILTLEEKEPRIVVDIKNVYSWKKHYKTPVNGRVIRQIRTYLHRNINKLRIVFDLNPAKDYIIDQSYNHSEFIYCIRVKYALSN